MPGVYDWMKLGSMIGKISAEWKLCKMPDMLVGPEDLEEEDLEIRTMLMRWGYDTKFLDDVKINQYESAIYKNILPENKDVRNSFTLGIYLIELEIIEANHDDFFLGWNKKTLINSIEHSCVILGVYIHDTDPETETLEYIEEVKKGVIYLQVSSDRQMVEKYKQYDVFISHATKDKIEYVDSLKKEIKKLDISIFYDTDELKWGDNWKKKILSSTEKSEFAIIVISENFFDREWTEKELNAFLNRQNNTEQKIVLPLLYNITPEKVKEKYPGLADIQYLIANYGSKKNGFSKKDIALKLASLLIDRYKSTR